MQVLYFNTSETATLQGFKKKREEGLGGRLPYLKAQASHDGFAQGPGKT